MMSPPSEMTSERSHVFSLQSLGPFGDLEFHSLTLLQALETACLYCGEVNKNISATLTADEAVTLRVIEPLDRTLFHKS